MDEHPTLCGRNVHSLFTSGTFNFLYLPTELQEKILVEAAVTRRLAGETMDEVKDGLEIASPEFVNSQRFSSRVQQLAFLRGYSRQLLTVI